MAVQEERERPHAGSGVLAPVSRWTSWYGGPSCPDGAAHESDHDESDNDIAFCVNCHETLRRTTDGC